MTLRELLDRTHPEWWLQFDNDPYAAAEALGLYEYVDRHDEDEWLANNCEEN